MFFFDQGRELLPRTVYAPFRRSDRNLKDEREFVVTQLFDKTQHEQIALPLFQPFQQVPHRRRRGVPRDFALASVAAENLRTSGELALRVVETMGRYEDVQLVAHQLTPLSADLRELMEKQPARK